MDAAVEEAEGVVEVVIAAAVAAAAPVVEAAIAVAVEEVAAVHRIRATAASVTPPLVNHRLRIPDPRHHPIHDPRRHPIRGLRRLRRLRIPDQVLHPAHMARQPRGRRDRRFSPEARAAISDPPVRMVPAHQ